MADNRMEGGESSNSPRRPSRQRHRATPLIASFKEQLDRTPRSEVDDLSNQLSIALGAIANGTAAGNSAIATVNQRPTGLTRKSKQNAQAATSTGRMLLGRPNCPPTGNSFGEKEKASTLSRGIASAGNLNRRPSTRNQRDSRAGVAASMTARIPEWDGYYKPISSSRRNSRAGSELAMSMKLSAQKALAELGEVSDDSDDDDWLALPLLKEEHLSA